MPTPYDFHLDDDDPAMDPEVELRDIAIEEKAEELLDRYLDDEEAVCNELQKGMGVGPAEALTSFWLMTREAPILKDSLQDRLYELMRLDITKDLTALAFEEAEAMVDAERGS